MTANPTIALELAFGAAILDAEGNAILDASDNAILDGGWADVIADARASMSIRIKKGNFSLTQNDRIADVGTLSCALDNSASNTEGVQGFYSPSNASVRDGFGETLKVRFNLTYGADAKYKFQGVRLDVIDPDSGTFGRQLTSITAVDWMDEATTTPARGLDVQLSQRDDQLIDDLLAVMDNQPESTSLAVGPDQYGAAFIDVKSESTKVTRVLQSLALSGFGTVFLNGTASSGEVLTYRSRHALLSTAVPVATLSNSMVNISAPRVSENRVKKVVLETQQLRIDSAATTEIYVLTQEVEIAAGATKKFTGRYKDPSNESVRIAATSIVDPLVADTHFKFSSVSGSGNDLNGDLGIVFTPNADAADFEFTNNSGVTGYLWFLKVIGKGVYLYDIIEHIRQDTSIKKGQVLNYDMIYQDSFDVGKNLSDFLLTAETGEENERPVVHFKANRTDALMAAAINVEPGDLVSITETVTGIDRKFFVNGVELDIKSKGRDIDVYWHCIPASDGNTFCILNAVGFAELNTTAKLAF